MPPAPALAYAKRTYSPNNASEQVADLRNQRVITMKFIASSRPVECAAHCNDFTDNIYKNATPAPVKADRSQYACDSIYSEARLDRRFAKQIASPYSVQGYSEIPDALTSKASLDLPPRGGRSSLTRQVADLRFANTWPAEGKLSVETRGSVFSGRDLPRDVTAWSRRLRRYAASLLKGEAPRTSEERTTPKIGGSFDDSGKWYPVCACSTTPHGAATAVSAMQRDSGSVSWAGLMRCGSVWTCAECATKIEAVRSKELLRLIETARGRGMIILMITHTFPHEAHHSCRESMEGLSASVRKMRQRKAYSELRSKLGFVGLARKREITIGWHGFHPHDHELWILDPLLAAIDIEDLARAGQSYKQGGRNRFGDSELQGFVKSQIYPIWAACAAQIFGADRVPTEANGLDVSVVWNANDYLAKCPELAAKKKEAGKTRWGADAEMSKTTAKRGRRGSRTPWELLEIAAGNCPSFADQRKAGQRCLTVSEARKLYLDYAAGTWRKRAMYWTPQRTLKDGTVVPSLRDRFAVGEELTDEQIAAGELPMTEAQAEREREKGDPIKIRVDLDLISLAALGRGYVDSLQDRLAPVVDRDSRGQTIMKDGRPKLQAVPILPLLRRDGWILIRASCPIGSVQHWEATHPAAMTSSEHGTATGMALPTAAAQSPSGRQNHGSFSR